MNIYVGNLPYSAKSQDLRAAFEPYGNVTAAEVIFDRRTKRSRGYGFVEMDDDDAARRAIAALNGTDFMGRELRVDESVPREVLPNNVFNSPIRGLLARRGCERDERKPQHHHSRQPHWARPLAHL